MLTIGKKKNYIYMDSHCIVLEMCLQFEICPSKNVFNRPPQKGVGDQC